LVDQASKQAIPGQEIGKGRIRHCRWPVLVLRPLARCLQNRAVDVGQVLTDRSPYQQFSTGSDIFWAFWRWFCGEERCRLGGRCPQLRLSDLALLQAVQSTWLRSRNEGFYNRARGIRARQSSRRFVDGDEHDVAGRLELGTTIRVWPTGDV